ncbi:MAG: hypothetical protein ACFFDT_13350 [Candidatus Hodarchaeota archaeon]
MKNTSLVLIFGSLLLVFFSSGCFFPSWQETHHYLCITKIESSFSSPIGNLTRSDISSIPVLHSVLNESLTFTLNESKEFELTEKELDQISQLFCDLQLPHEEEYGTIDPWYIFFEASLFEIELYSVLTYYN